MPEVVIVDEISTHEEALACRSIAERGVQLVGTAHGQILENLLKNPSTSDLVGGVQSVTLGGPYAASCLCCCWQAALLASAVKLGAAMPGTSVSCHYGCHAT